MKRIVIVAGGTGGHIFPGMAIAAACVEAGYQVSWLGSERGLEKTLVPGRYDFHQIPAFQLRGKGLLAVLLMPARLLRATFRAAMILRRIKPQLVMTMGGFVAAPAGLAAKILGCPLVIHEQNARAGMANRYLSYLADLVLTAFPGAFSRPLKKSLVVGNPVRRRILQIPEPTVRLATHADPLRILVLGGSLGAKAINELVLNWLLTLGASQPVSIWHQTGQYDFDRISQQYGRVNGSNIKLVPFIDKVEEAFEWADVVICRAGAMTVSELAAIGLASILIPMPHAVDNHQYYNARYLSDAGGAYLLEHASLSLEALDEKIRHFIADRAALLKMSLAARSVSHRQATEAIMLSCRVFL